MTASTEMPHDEAESISTDPRNHVVSMVTAHVNRRAAVTRLDDYRHPGEAAAPPLQRPNLSDREVEVLLAWLAAESKEEAASRLFISASTVSTHLARIRAKYSGVGRTAPTKTHLFARALQDGYTSLDRW